MCKCTEIVEPVSSKTTTIDCLLILSFGAPLTRRSELDYAVLRTYQERVSKQWHPLLELESIRFYVVYTRLWPSVLLHVFVFMFLFTWSCLMARMHAHIIAVFFLFACAASQ